MKFYAPKCIMSTVEYINEQAYGSEVFVLY